MLEKYPDDVKLVIKHFPLKNHKFALKASKAALSANMQGKFWEFHEELFENHKGLNDKEIQDIAKDLGLDTEKFAKDMDSVPVAKMIKDDLLNGRQIGVSGTPSVFINGKILKKSNLTGFSEMIEAELKKE